MTEQPKKPMDSQIIMIIMLIGLSAGILSGLIGIGGGILVVPALVFFMHYTQHQAQGTSLGVLSFPVVILGFLKYYFDGKKPGGDPIDFRIVGLLAAGFFIGAFFGSSLALKINQQLLRKLFAIVLLYSAFKMLDADKWLAGLFRKIF